MSSRAAYQNWAADGLRFVLAGTANTLITLAAYQLLLFVMPAWLAYTSSWVGGLLFVIVFYPSRVFAGARRDFAARALLGGSYAAVFLLGLGTLRFLATAGLAPRLSIFAVLAVTTISNFLLGRFILKKGGGTAALSRRND
jgi:putative flippase GtrA